MIETEMGIICVAGPAKAAIFLKTPHECKRCHRMVMIILNEGGATRCMTCPESTDVVAAQ